ncbi:MAG: tRNA (guanosine(46)-N7)-methyltransferase TrmB [Thermoanaerobaculia bacterium]
MSESTAAATEFGINPRESGVAQIDPVALFGNANPLIVEIGSGKGRFLLESARANPGMNWIGTEWSLHYYRVIVQRLQKWDVRNARVINYDASIVLASMLPSESVREIHIYFPDPWPRKRETKRRIIRTEVLHQMKRVLEPGGVGWYVTDHKDYFEAALPLFEDLFAVDAGEVRSEVPPRTNYEAKYREAGRPIYQVRFGKR